MTRSCNPSTWEANAGTLLWFNASMVYIISSRPTRPTRVTLSPKTVVCSLEVMWIISMSQQHLGDRGKRVATSFEATTQWVTGGSCLHSNGLPHKVSPKSNCSIAYMMCSPFNIYSYIYNILVKIYSMCHVPLSTMHTY